MFLLTIAAELLLLRLNESNELQNELHHNFGHEDDDYWQRHAKKQVNEAYNHNCDECNKGNTSKAGKNPEDRTLLASLAASYG